MTDLKKMHHPPIRFSISGISWLEFLGFNQIARTPSPRAIFILFASSSISTVESFVMIIEASRSQISSTADAM